MQRTNERKAFLYTKISNTSCTANTVNIFLNVTGQIKIDDVLHIADVQTPCSHLENVRLKSEYVLQKKKKTVCKKLNNDMRTF